MDRICFLVTSMIFDPSVKVIISDFTSITIFGYLAIYVNICKCSSITFSADLGVDLSAHVIPKRTVAQYMSDHFLLVNSTSFLFSPFASYNISRSAYRLC